MAKITLATIAESLDAKYGSTIVELGDGSEVELLNPLRLGPEGRRALLSLGGNDTDTDDEREPTAEEQAARQEAQVAQLVGLVRTVAATEKQGDSLIAACSPRGYVDVMLLGEIVSDYMGAERVGEASPSQD